MGVHNHALWSDANIIWVTLAVLLLTSHSTSGILAKPSEDVMTGDKFPITGSEFYRRSQFDRFTLSIGGNPHTSDKIYSVK